jgi:hypothetical protein
MKTSELKKALGFYFKDEFNRITPSYTWARIKCIEKTKEMVLVASSDNPAIDELRSFVQKINEVIVKNWPDCTIKMSLTEFSITIYQGAAK